MTYRIFFIALLIFNIQVLQAQVGIGTTTPNSTLTVDGSFSATATILSADTTLDETHYMVWSNGHVVTLPDGALCPGRIYIIKSGTSATVTPAGGNTIDGSTNSITLASDEFIIVQSLLGGAWVITTTTGAKEINDLSDGKTGGVPGYSLYLGEFAGGAAIPSVPFNTGVGVAALGGNTANGQNTAIGYGAGGNITTGQLNIMLGYETHSSATAASNELNIGKAIYGTNIYNVGAARIGINQQTPNASAALDITSTTMGLLIPRMTQAQRDAITTPATSLMIYQTDATSGFYYYDGSAWVSATGAKEISDLSDGKTTPTNNLYLGSTASSNPALLGSLVIGNGVVDGTGGGNNGLYNTYIGMQTGETTGNTGFTNTAVGATALKKNTSGYSNTAIGEGVLRNNTSGYGNTGLGVEVLRSNFTGFENVGVGQYALQNSTNGRQNVAVGFEALNGNTLGRNNIGIGYDALYHNTIGRNNIAIGQLALYNADATNATTNGKENIGIGSLTLQLMTTGNENIAIGNQALPQIGDGENNIGIGFKSGLGISTGDNNTIIGATPSALVGAADLQGNILIANGLGEIRIRAITNGNVGINEQAPNSTLQVGGSLSLPINSGTTDYTLTDNDYTYLTDGANVILPTAVGIKGRIYIIKNIGTTTQTVSTTLSETIDGATSKSLVIILGSLPSMTVQSDGANWWIISRTTNL